MRQAEILEAGTASRVPSEGKDTPPRELTPRESRSKPSASSRFSRAVGVVSAESGLGRREATVRAPEARSAASGSCGSVPGTSAALASGSVASVPVVSEPVASVAGASFTPRILVPRPPLSSGPMACGVRALPATEARSSAVSMSATACLQLLTTGQVHRAAKAVEPARGGKNRIVTS